MQPQGKAPVRFTSELECTKLPFKHDLKSLAGQGMLKGLNKKL